MKFQNFRKCRSERFCFYENVQKGTHSVFFAFKKVFAFCSKNFNLRSSALESIKRSTLIYEKNFHFETFISVHLKNLSFQNFFFRKKANFKLLFTYNACREPKIYFFQKKYDEFMGVKHEKCRKQTPFLKMFKFSYATALT